MPCRQGRSREAEIVEQFVSGLPIMQMPFRTRRSSTRGTPSRFVGQQRFDHAPFEVGQIISAHADAESEFGTI
jgi:hypothetical protein